MLTRAVPNSYQSADEFKYSVEDCISLKYGIGFLKNSSIKNPNPQIYFFSEKIGLFKSIYKEQKSLIFSTGKP